MEETQYSAMVKYAEICNIGPLLLLTLPYEPETDPPRAYQEMISPVRYLFY